MAGPFSRGITERAFLFLTACLLTYFRLAPSAFSSQESPGGRAISSQVNLVVLPVTVLDRDGRFVSGLDASGFQIYENGQPQKITLFRREDLPVTVGLVVDHSGSMIARQADVVAGAQAFAQSSNPQDREFVVNFNDRVFFGLPENSPFTNDPEDLREALSATSAIGRTALYDALGAALKHLQSDQHDKRVLLLISDGGDDASKGNFGQVLQLARSANIVIYAVGLLDEHNADQNPGVLMKLTQETGGRVYFPTSGADVVTVCKEIAADIRHQYTLGYSPADPTRSGYRKIRVSVTTPGKGKLSVRTRAGYFVSPNTSSGAAATSRRGL